MTRRDIIRSGAWLALTLPTRYASRLLAAPRFTSDPYQSGVASGDPTPDSVVLWTRLIPSADASWQRENVEVLWEIAEDESMRHVVRRGRERATPELGHSIHATPVGLKPDRWYWYRFIAGGHSSPVGRTRTAPASTIDRLRFAFASCQHYETGYYTPYRHMNAEDLDLVIHLGDYIYEGPERTTGVRRHTGTEIKTLTDYRNRYALYRTDPDLREAHRLFPWIVTWDDHEVDNNYAGEKPEDNQSREDFLERRANAYQAYYEAMPLRRSSLPSGSSMQLYRRLSYGPLAEFFVLDTRQYRTDQPCGDGNKPPCADMTARDQTMFGPQQEQWLMEGLSGSGSQWNILCNQVMMAKIDRDGGQGEIYPMDQWSGYDTARLRFMQFLARSKPSNPVVVTGDVHSSWVCDLRERFRDSASPILATEFTGTSISSGGDGMDIPPAVASYLPDNPQVKFHNAQRGYVSCELTAKNMTARYRIVDRVTVPRSPIRTRASFTVESGRAGALKA